MRRDPSLLAAVRLPATLALLAAACISCGWSAEADPTAALRQELTSPSTQAPCPLPPDADPSNIGDVMETGFSPAMSKLSFLLNHDDQSTPDQKRQSMVEATAQLLGCVQLAGGNTPTSHRHLEGHYAAMMTDLRDEVALLQLTAIENDRRGSQHMFDHVRMQCARCHLIYKPGSAE